MQLKDFDNAESTNIDYKELISNSYSYLDFYNFLIIFNTLFYILIR